MTDHKELIFGGKLGKATQEGLVYCATWTPLFILIWFTLWLLPEITIVLNVTAN